MNLPTTRCLLAAMALQACAPTPPPPDGGADVVAMPETTTEDTGPSIDADRAPVEGGVDAPPAPDAVMPAPDVVVDTPRPPQLAPQIDLLFVIDNSNSMRENQANLMAQLGPMLDALISPPDRNNDGRTDYQPVRDLHVGVVSTDLGTYGSTIPGCANPTLGDDGRLNPIRYGGSLAQHLPWAPMSGEAAPAGFRPADCTNKDEFPAFLSFCSPGAGVTCPTNAETNRMPFERAFRCNVGLWVGGCGLEQQLEAVWRALLWHDARSTPGNTAPNAGFLREEARLVIMMLTDEEDMSVRDCRFARGAPCNDATSVFQTTAMNWASPNLNLRGYLYTPGGPQDPTWPLERYVDPRNPSAGFLSLKPGHPERVFFGAITGVPLDVPTRRDAMGNVETDWDALLGTPGAGGADDFAGRNMASAYSMMSAEGPVSMRLGPTATDPNCSERVVPACRRQGTMYSPTACTSVQQYFAFPSRRIVEVARRMSASPLCGGQPCRAGFVSSICALDYARTLTPLIDWLSRGG